MTFRIFTLVAALVATIVAGSIAHADDELGKRASWRPSTARAVKLQVDKLLVQQGLDDLTKLRLETLWPEDADFQGEKLLEQLALTIAIFDDNVKSIVDLCRDERIDPVAQEFPVLQDESADVFVRNNLRLYYGRWLAQHDLYDESLEQLAGLTPADVVDPASLLFYQSVGYHRLLDKDKCLVSLSLLLENEDAIPKRYATLGQMMTADIQPLKPDSLDEIARLMDDIRRRQELYRSGKIVIDKEEDVIAKLDKIIEELEEQAKKGGGSGPGGGSSPSSPLPDSQAAGGSGAGNVDRRTAVPGGDWGSLPPKEHEAAMAELAKDLPGHYREVIEEYFKRLAREEPR